MLTTIRVDRGFPIVRATVPLDGKTRWTEDASPFVLHNSSGVELVTQWERVTGAGDDWRSVRVAELIAVDPSPPSGTASYTVHPRPAGSPVREHPASPGPWARTLAAPGSLSLVIDGVATAFTQGPRYRSGAAAVTIKLYAPHAFGWLTVFEGLNIAWLDLVIHNALPNTPAWFFNELALSCSTPPLHMISSSPEWGVGLRAGGGLMLVPARTDGKLHGLEQRGWRVFQGALHDGSPSDVTKAQMMVDGAGWGVSDAWSRVDAYQPQALRLPDLAYRANEMRQTLRADAASIAHALQTGIPYGMGTNQGGRLDWRHPWGSKYGGITGGSYRFQWSGVEVASTGEPQGLYELRARLRMLADRSPVAIVDHDGAPALLEDWIDSHGAAKGGWRMSAADALFHQDGAFGWSKQTAMPPAVQVPDEYAELQTYSPVDFQHCDVAQKAAESAIYLSNDPIAKWWVRMSAELWRMSRFTDNRLLGDWNQANSNPGQGASVGRADGHSWSNAATAFAVGTQAHRDRWMPAIERFVETLSNCQMPNGLFRRDYLNKEAKTPPFGDGTHANNAISKGTEEALIAYALFGLARSCFGQVEASTFFDCVDRWANHGLWDFLTGAGAVSAFSNYVGTVPVTWTIDANGVVHYTLGQPVTDIHAVVRDGTDRTEIASPLGCAMLWRAINGQPFSSEQSHALQLWAGGSPDPLTWMKTRTLYALQLDDCAPAHAALQFVP